MRRVRVHWRRSKAFCGNLARWPMRRRQAGKKDLQVMIARAEAAREVLDLLLFSRPASAQALALLGLPKAVASAEQIEHLRR